MVVNAQPAGIFLRRFLVSHSGRPLATLVASHNISSGTYDDLFPSVSPSSSTCETVMLVEVVKKLGRSDNTQHG